MSITNLAFEDFLARAADYVAQRDRFELEATVLLARLVRDVLPAAAWVEMAPNDIDDGCLALSVHDADGVEIVYDVRATIYENHGDAASAELDELAGWLREGGVWAAVAGEWVTTQIEHVVTNTGPVAWASGALFLDVEKALALDVEKVLAMPSEELIALAYIPVGHVYRSFVKERPAPVTAEKPATSVPVKAFPAGDEITCGCGNRPDLDGFSTSDETGALKCDDGRNPSEDWDGVHYVCDACGQVWAQQPVAVPAS